MAYEPHKHSFVCCDLDHGSSSADVGPPPPTAPPCSPCPFETYCCLDEHCSSPSACDDTCQNVPCNSPSCDNKQCNDACGDTCTDSCDKDCNDACQPCSDPTCEPAVTQPCYPQGCTIEEYIQRCTDAACTLPQIELDPLALLAQPQTANYYDLLSAAWTSLNPSVATASATLPQVNNNHGPPAPMPHVCHWQNCHRSFDNMPVLLAHIATDHLSVPGYDSHPTQPAQGTPTAHANNNAFNIEAATATPLQAQAAQATQALQSHGDLLSCLWDDCFPFDNLMAQDAVPKASNSNSVAHTPHSQPDSLPPPHSHPHPHPHPHAHGELSPQTMLRHLLEDHLGGAELLGAVNQDNAHAHRVLTHKHSHPHPHHPVHEAAAPHAHGHGHAHHAPHDAHAQAHAHHALGPHHHHHPVKLPPTPSPTPPSHAASHVCLWPGCTVREPFASAGDLMEHLSEEHVGRGRDSYRCFWDGCGGAEGRLFSSRQKVLRHLQSHTGHRPYVCSECGQSFSEAAPLAAHMRRHSDNKPYVCDHPGCGKAFAISSSLTIHRRTHNGERPFVCPHCKKGFVEASNLTKHIRTHTGERPFPCTHPGCGRRFSRPDQLKRHALIHDAGHKGRLAAKARA